MECRLCACASLDTNHVTIIHRYDRLRYITVSGVLVSYYIREYRVDDKPIIRIRKQN